MSQAAMGRIGVRYKVSVFVESMRHGRHERHGMHVNGSGCRWHGLIAWFFIGRLGRLAATTAAQQQQPKCQQLLKGSHLKSRSNLNSNNVKIAAVLSRAAAMGVSRGVQCRGGVGKVCAQTHAWDCCSPNSTRSKAWQHFSPVSGGPHTECHGAHGS
eukprot:1158059-Pelagomonas_calceolata.AAC.6